MKLADWALREDIPTRPPPVPPTGPPPPWTAAQQAEHRRTLLAALHGWVWDDDDSLSTARRHLRLVRRGEAQAA
ncbi:hypothetical protein ACJWDR_37725 [Streptomyces tauricus]|uniref:hypothetical protein n=1 Tax=Streptomyces tauricus TaxID=68274 RepID=UPI00387F37A5